MLNLCHFDVIVGSDRFAAHSARPLVWTPILETAERFDHLTGYVVPESLDVLDIPEGTEVIVPRFAAAVAWALSAGLVPFCVPLTSKRDPSGATACDVLEPAPAGLELALGDLADERGGLIHDELVRAIPGSFAVQVFDGPDLPAVPLAELAVRLPDDSVQLPASLAHDFAGGILVPADGVIVAAVLRVFPLAAVLITDVIRTGQRTRLFQIA